MRPSAPIGADSANRSNSAKSTPSSFACRSSTSAAFKVHASGKNLLSTSANPAISIAPVPAESEIEKTVPLVPMETTASPVSSASPLAAPALSPAPPAIAIWVPNTFPPTWPFSRTLGRCRAAARCSPKQNASTSGTYLFSSGLKYPVPLASLRSVQAAAKSAPRGVASSP